MASEHRNSGVFDRYDLTPVRLYYYVRYFLAVFMAGSLVAIFSGYWVDQIPAYSSLPFWVFAVALVVAGIGFAGSILLVVLAMYRAANR